MPAFSRQGGRLFVRYIPQFILASQRHESAPRLTATQKAAMKAYSALVDDPDHWVEMTFEAGDMQFVNNYHVLHGRRGRRRHGIRSSPLAQTAVARNRDPWSRGSTGPVPSRRGNGALVGQAHQGVTRSPLRVRVAFTPMSRFHDFTMASLEGEQVSFSDFADQACLIVNVASA